MSKEILNYLEELISDKDIARMVVENAKIPLARIDFDGAPRKVWYRIISESKKYKDGIQRIIQSALDEYPEDEFLKKMRNNLSSNSQDNISAKSDNSKSISSIDKTELKDLIGQNKINEVLEKLKQHNGQLDSNQQNEIIGLNNRYNTLEREKRQGILSTSEQNIQKNKLMMTLLAFIDSI